jgi:hypothetical protein
MAAQSARRAGTDLGRELSRRGLQGGRQQRHRQGFRPLPERIWGKAIHRIVTENTSPEQAVDEAIARIKHILSAWSKAAGIGSRGGRTLDCAYGLLGAE